MMRMRCWGMKLDVIGPQCSGETAAKHADDHHAVNTGQRAAVEVNQLVVTPFFCVNAHQLQELAAPAGEFAGDGPKGAGDTKVPGGENPGRDHRGHRFPEGNQVLLFKGVPGHCFRL